MLNEGWRAHTRGKDVVIGYVETYDRPNTRAQIRDLEVLPRATVEYRGQVFEEMDLDGLLARHPEIALVDELAHTNVPGSRHKKRWEDVEELLDAGINVISTVNVQHLESLNDVVERITGVAQRETIPDAVVRAADQIELVDMSAEALRRRMAHGNVYPPEKVDAASATTSVRATSSPCGSWPSCGWRTGSTRPCTTTASGTASRCHGRRASG